MYQYQELTPFPVAQAELEKGNRISLIKNESN
jgi:hypothetical protein